MVSSSGALLLLASLMNGLSSVDAQSYALGGPDPICWLSLISPPPNNPNASIPSRVQLAQCPEGTTVVYGQDAPTGMVHNTDANNILEYTMHVDYSHLDTTMDGSSFTYADGCGASDSNAEPVALVAPFSTYVMDQDITDGDGLNDIGHANIHSCGKEVGFCVPFIGNDGKLATHTAALKGDWTFDSANMVGEAVFESHPVLEEGGYTIIAHGRFYFYGADDAVWKMDMAAAYLGVIVEPQKQEIIITDEALAVTNAVIYVSLLFLLILLSFTLVKNDHKVMKMSQVPVIVMMLISGIATVASTLLLPMMGDDVCPLKNIIAIPLTFMVGLLYGKVKRVLILTQSKRLTKTRVTSLYVAAWALGLTLPQLVIQLLPMMSDPMKEEIVWKDNGVDYQYVCDSESADAWAIIMLVYSLIILCVGAWSARLSSTLASSFNEAGYIATAMYSISLLAFITIPVAFVVDNPSSLLIVTTLAICASVCVTMGLIVIPKAKLIMANVKVAVGFDQTGSSSDINTGTMSSTSTMSTVDAAAGPTTPKVRKFYKKGELKEDAIPVLDDLFAELGKVKHNYDNMFPVPKEDMQSTLDALAKVVDMGMGVNEKGDLEAGAK